MATNPMEKCLRGLTVLRDKMVAKHQSGEMWDLVKLTSEVKKLIAQVKALQGKAQKSKR